MNENRNIVYESLSMAQQEGALAARATLVEGCSTTISLLNGETDTMQSATNRALHLNIFTDGRYGVFTTNRLDTDEVRTFIANAVKATRLLVPDECRTLPDRSICYDGKGEDLRLVDERYFDITPEEKIDYLKKVAAQIPADSRLISTENQYEDFWTSETVTDTNGLDVSDTQTFFSASTECTVRGEGDVRPQNWWTDGSIRFSELGQNNGAMALRRSIDMIGAEKIASGHYDAVLENTCARSLVSTLMEALGGSALQQRNSFLVDSLGKKLFPEGMTLCDRPHIPGMTGSTWYDSEGIATADRDIIAGGKVCTYFLGTYYARKMALPVTVQSPSACRFLGVSDLDCSGMMRTLGRGIFITGFNGGNCNSLTGDFSYGVEGFLFENGEKVHPIKEMNFSGNMMNLWANLLLVGNDPKSYTRWQIPSLAFSRCEFSGL